MLQKRVGFVGAGFNAQFHIRSWVGVRGADVLGIVSRDRAEDAAALARDAREALGSGARADG